tara:strand:+ start:1999 stop:2163 length:165 start_codon:yes stop_codon:yes gene_type:complete
MENSSIIEAINATETKMNEAMNEFEESLMATIKMVQTVNEQTIEVSSVSPDEEE